MDHGLVDGERGKRSTCAGTRDVVTDALAERVHVQAVDEPPDGIVLITIRLPDGITEQLRLATQEWVQLRLADLEGQDGLVYVDRYV